MTDYLEKMKSHVFSTARDWKKKLSENNPTVTIKMEVFVRRGGIKPDRRYVFSIAGREFEAEDDSLYEVEKVSRMLENVGKALNMTRGYLVRENKDVFWYEARDVFGMTTRHIDITSGLVLFTKPCKEFNSLCRYLKRETTLVLNDTDLYRVSVVGKRGRDYRESGARHYYAHDAELCKKVLNWLHKYKTSVCTLKASIEESSDCEDMDYSREYETESYGTKHRLLYLRVFTRNGEEKAKCNTMYM